MTVSETNLYNRKNNLTVKPVQVYSFYTDPLGHNELGLIRTQSLVVGFCPTFQSVWAISPIPTQVVSGTAKSLYSERCLT